MVSKDITIRVCYDLIMIHRERKDYYQLANYVSIDYQKEISAIFAEIVNQSKNYEEDIIDAISRYDGEAKKYENRRRGNIYGMWNKNKGELFNKDAKSLIDASKTELRVLCRSYETALKLSDRMEPTMSRLIESQLIGLNSTLDSIDNYQSAL
jgi:hypothetical protein